MQLLTPQDTADILGVDVAQVEAVARTHRIRRYNLGGLLRYSAESVVSARLRGVIVPLKAAS